MGRNPWQGERYCGFDSRPVHQGSHSARRATIFAAVLLSAEVAASYPSR